MLNPQQLAAVHYIDGPLLVLAGAGSGKTRVIIQKISYLIQQCGYAGNTIFAVTFTNKAANEMRTRIHTLLPGSMRRGLTIATFHTLGLQLLKRNPHAANLKEGFSIFDSEDSQQLMRGHLTENQANDRDYLSFLARTISRWKNELLTPEAVLNLSLQDAKEANAATVYVRYQQSLQAYNAVDFDDLIRLAVQLLQSNPHLLEYWQGRVKHLLIDEYQDSNTSQYLLMKLLTGERARFTVVGDDDQSIYAWRGARPENMQQLQKDYQDLQVIKLEQNYRSTSRILNAANCLIQNNSHLFQPFGCVTAEEPQ